LSRLVFCMNSRLRKKASNLDTLLGVIMSMALLWPGNILSSSSKVGSTKAVDKVCLVSMLGSLVSNNEGEVLDNLEFFNGKLTQGYMRLGRGFDKDSIYIGVANHPDEVIEVNDEP